MDDLEFFDVLYQGWSKTTGAADTFWMPEEVAELHDGYRIVSVRQDQTKETVAANLTEDDAAWITALHGCFADLTRRLHEAVDEAERFDCEKDRVINEMALLAEENNELRERLSKYETVGD